MIWQRYYRPPFIGVIAFFAVLLALPAALRHPLSAAWSERSFLCRATPGSDYFRAQTIRFP